jgi:hypothetical protein
MELGMEKIKWQSFKGGFYVFLEKRVKWILFTLLLSLVLFGGWVWYGSVYRADWSEAEKQTYIQAKGRGTLFNKERFDELVSEKETRAKAYQEEPSNPEDMFRLKQ